jgi:hypothetical protein
MIMVLKFLFFWEGQITAKNIASSFMKPDKSLRIFKEPKINNSNFLQKNLNISNTHVTLGMTLG